MIYGKRRRMMVLFSYTFDGGAGHATIAIDGYHGMSNKKIVEIRTMIEEDIGKSIVIVNWKLLHERK